jgi:hypothetical protein
LASQVNMNFAQLKEWLEQKVGTAGTAAVTVTGGAVVSNGLAAYSGAPVAAPASTGRAAIFTGNTGAPTAPILEVRHDNLTQGIGIGWNTVTAVGSLPDIGINVQAKGNAVIGMNSHVSFNAGVCRPVSTPCDAQGTGSVIFLDRHNVACNGGEYLQQFRVQVCAGTANFRYDYTCCSF